MKTLANKRLFIRLSNGKIENFAVENKNFTISFALKNNQNAMGLDVYDKIISMNNIYCTARNSQDFTKFTMNQST